MPSHRSRRRRTAPVRRRHLRLYPFEALALANLVAFGVLLRAHDLGPSLTMLTALLRPAATAILTVSAIGAGIHLVVAAAAGRWRALVRRWLRPAALGLYLRLALAAYLVIVTYTWLKLLLPLLRYELYDAVLWELDRRSLLGLSPNVLFLNAFRSPLALRTIDLTYGTSFFGALALATGLLLTHPWDRLRLSWATGATALWTVGAWLYFLLPALGPCYVFPDLWAPHVDSLRGNAATQHALFDNYHRLLALRAGSTNVAYRVSFGIAAFPSLHVASQLFVALWARHGPRWLARLAFLSFGLVFVGSVVTGWHYLIDSWAGALLGGLAFYVAARAYGLGRAARRSRSEATPAQAGPTRDR